MGLPSGLKWAPMNIDGSKEKGFALSPFQYDCSFISWGNIDTHNPIDENNFGYDWGSVNAEEPWYEGQVYGSTTGSELVTDIDIAHDVARQLCGEKWRIPTSDEFKELIDNCDFVQADGTTVIDAGTTNKIVTVNGVDGIYLKSKTNGNLLFFACSGFGHDTTWYNRGSNGDYWASSYVSSRNARRLYFNSGGVNPQDINYRAYGYPVRPVYDQTI